MRFIIISISNIGNTIIIGISRLFKIIKYLASVNSAYPLSHKVNIRREMVEPIRSIGSRGQWSTIIHNGLGDQSILCFLYLWHLLTGGYT
jgi:hypothetical protein